MSNRSNSKTSVVSTRGAAVASRPMSRRDIIFAAATGGVALLSAPLLWPTDLLQKSLTVFPESLNHGSVPNTGIYNSNVMYDFKPEFIEWSVGGVPFSSVMDQASSDFAFRYKPAVFRSVSFRNAVLEGLKKVDRDRAEKVVALMASGGPDSEALAIGMLELGIPFEMYFLNVWNINLRTQQEWVVPFSKRHGIKLNVVNLDASFFKNEYVPEAFSFLGTELPTYLAMTYLFDKVPKNQFILCGEGDLDKVSPVYQQVWDRWVAAQNKPDLSGIWLPFSYSEVVYRVWAQRAQHFGQYYFYSSTPELVSSAVKHPLFEYRTPFASTKKMLAHEFPEVPPRIKTTNWDYGYAFENASVRKIVYDIAASTPKYSFWRQAIGTFANLRSFS